MLLTEFVSPIFVNNFVPNTDEYESSELLSAPMILTGIRNKFVASKLWKGALYGPQNVLKGVKVPLSNFGLNPFTYKIEHNEPLSIVLPDSNIVEVTLVPLGDLGDSMLLLKDMYITVLVTTALDNIVDELIQNSMLKNNVRTGIDVLYIDDSTYECQREKLLTVVYLIQPKSVYSIHNNKLPRDITSLCKKRDMFKEIKIRPIAEYAIE